MAGLNGRIGNFSLDEKLLFCGSVGTTSTFNKHYQNQRCFVEMCPSSIRNQHKVQEQIKVTTNRAPNGKIIDHETDNENKQELIRNESSTESSLTNSLVNKTTHENSSSDVGVSQILKPMLPVYNWDGTGGCLSCGMDDDYSLLLICELCNAEYHTYCLNPPLESVPEGDFYCGRFSYFSCSLLIY